MDSGALVEGGKATCVGVGAASRCLAVPFATRFFHLTKPSSSSYPSRLATASLVSASRDSMMDAAVLGVADRGPPGVRGDFVFCDADGAQSDAAPPSPFPRGETSRPPSTHDADSFRAFLAAAACEVDATRSLLLPFRAFWDPEAIGRAFSSP